MPSDDFVGVFAWPSLAVGESRRASEGPGCDWPATPSEERLADDLGDCMFVEASAMADVSLGDCGTEEDGVPSFIKGPSLDSEPLSSITGFRLI